MDPEATGAGGGDEGGSGRGDGARRATRLSKSNPHLSTLGSHVKKLTNTHLRLDAGLGGGADVSGSISSARLHIQILVSNSHSTH